jgi:hypothetical protein
VLSKNTGRLEDIFELDLNQGQFRLFKYTHTTPFFR